MSDLYSIEELKSILGGCGENVRIDKSVRLINPQNIFIGSNVRIDSWCFLSASHRIVLGNNVHIAHATHLAGGGGEIIINDFCGVSARVNIFTATDDYTEGYLTNPTIPDEYKKVKTGAVILEKHVIIGCGSVVMPGCVLKVGAAVGALCFVNKKVIPEFTVVSGNPLKVICKRNKENLLEMERKFLSNERA